MKKLYYFYRTLIFIVTCAEATERGDSDERYRIFCATQKIKIIATILAKAAREYHGIRFQDRIKDAIPDDRCKTKRGLYLTHKTYPRALLTPWGRLPIFNTPPFSKKIPDMLKNLKELLNIHSLPGHTSIYRISDICGKKLPRINAINRLHCIPYKNEWAYLKNKFENDPYAQEEKISFTRRIKELINPRLPHKELEFFDITQEEIITLETFREMSDTPYRLAAVLVDNQSKAYGYYLAENLAAWLKKSECFEDPLHNPILRITIFEWHPEAKRFFLIRSFDQTELPLFAQELQK
ncbi:MAG: hypothetical protein K2X90_00705 [Candidatus Babeliaceae bacterium]|nr:hypothetical protein [Candidatus Babeliaceae bacterium]